MRKFLSGILLPFILFASGILLLSCTPPPPEDAVTPEHSNTTASTPNTLKDDSLLNTIQDIARIQLQTSRYINQIQQSQLDLQDALAQGDRQAIQHSLAALNQQLTNFKLALNEVNLSTKEINQLRHNIVQLTDKLLNNPSLKNQNTMLTLNIEKIQKQLDAIQSDLFKLNNLFDNESSHDTAENTSIHANKHAASSQ